MEPEDAWAEIVALLRGEFRPDVGAFRTTVLRHQVAQQMRVLGLGLDEYVALLRESADMRGALHHALLVGCTEFFREPEAFEAIANALQTVLAQRPPDHVPRVWVPACATGEEAYSIAILVAECRGASNADDAQVFATDVDLAALTTARNGIYPLERVAHVGEARLRRFFERAGDDVRVRQELRKQIVFAPHDLLSDPPFAKLDLISCRNVLIYFEPALGAAVQQLLHYALAPGGVLVLGKTESAQPERFDVVDRHWKIYRRRGVASSPTIASFGDEQPPLNLFPLGRARALSTQDQLIAAHEETRSREEQLRTAKTAIGELHGRVSTLERQLDEAIRELRRARDDLRNVIEHARLAVVLLGPRLEVTAFSERVRDLIPLEPSDIGRPITDLSWTVPYATFVRDAEDVMRTLEPREAGLIDGERHYRACLAPYRTADNAIEGVVLMFTERVGP